MRHPCFPHRLLLVSPRGVRGERPWKFGCPHCADGGIDLHAWLGLSAACAAGVEHLLSEPPRRMKSEQPGPMSRERPEAAAECNEDRVRTLAQPEALDSGPCELCVGQEVALKAAPPRHTPPVQRAHLHPATRGLIGYRARRAPRKDKSMNATGSAGSICRTSEKVLRPGCARPSGRPWHSHSGAASPGNAGPARSAGASSRAPRPAP